MVEGGGDEGAVVEVVLGNGLEGVAGFGDGEEAVVGDEVEVVAGDDGGGAVLAGGVEAFVVDDLAGGGVDAGEDAAIADEVEAVLVVDGGGEFGNAAAKFPGEVGVGDVAGGGRVGRADGGEPGFEGARAEVGDEFFAGPEAVAVFIDVVEEGALAFGAARGIGWDGDAEAGMSGGNFGTEWEGEVFGDFVGGDFLVFVRVEVEHRFPERFEIGIFFGDAAHGGGGVDVVAADDGNDGGFAGEAGDEPFFRAGGGIVRGEASAAEDDEVFDIVVRPDDGSGPAAAVKRARRFPGEFAGIFVEGDKARAAEFAVGQVGVVIEDEDEQIAMQGGGTGGAVEIFRRGNGFGPEFVSIEVVANEAVGTEVNEEAFGGGDGSGGSGAIEVVDWFDGNFGRGATPEEPAGLRIEREGDEAGRFESGEEKFVSGNNGRGMAGRNGHFPREIVGGYVSGWRGIEGGAGTVWAAETGPGWIGGEGGEEKGEEGGEDC